MKRYLLPVILFLSAVVFYSCNESPSNSGNNNGPTALSLNGSLPSWSFGTGYYLAVCVTPGSKYQKTVLDSCAIGADGSFSIVLPALDDKYYDDTVNFGNVHCFDSIVMQPAFQKDARTVFEIHKDGAIKGAVTGKKHLVGMDSTGTYFLTYRAFSASGNIYGRSLCYINNGTYVDTAYTVYNVNVSKGWNTMLNSVTSKSNGRTEYFVDCTDHLATVFWIYNINP